MSRRAWEMIERETCPVYANATIDPSREVMMPLRVDTLNAAERVVERLLTERDSARISALREVLEMVKKMRGDWERDYGKAKAYDCGRVTAFDNVLDMLNSMIAKETR